MTCKCYHADKNFLGEIGVCWGTKECEACSCGGDESKCDFYDYVRERASLSQKQTRADRIRAMTDEGLAQWTVRKNQCPDGYTSFFGPNCVEDNGCELCWLEWLRQEAHDEP